VLDDDPPGDIEEEAAIDWAMASSKADAIQRESELRHRDATKIVVDSGTVTRTAQQMIYGDGITIMTAVPCGTTTILPSGRGGYSASRRGSEEHAPRDLMQVRPAPVFSLQTAMSERVCPLQESLACDLRTNKPSVGIVVQSALVKRRRCCEVANDNGGPNNSGSALGAVLGDDDCVHTCRGSDEAGIELVVERHVLQSVFNNQNCLPAEAPRSEVPPPTGSVLNNAPIKCNDDTKSSLHDEKLNAKRARLQETLGTLETRFFFPLAPFDDPDPAGSTIKNSLKVERRELQSDMRASSHPDPGNVKSDTEPTCSPSNGKKGSASTQDNNSRIVPCLTNSALHDSNSVNNSPPGVGGSGVSASSSGALPKPCLAIKSGGSPFLLGALNGSPATTAPNGDHVRRSGVHESFQEKRKRFQTIKKSPLGVGGSGVSSGVSGGGVASTIASGHLGINNNQCVPDRGFSGSQFSIQSANSASICTALNEDKVDTVLPPPRDDVPPSAACATPVFVACDSLSEDSFAAKRRRLQECHIVQSRPFFLGPVSSSVVPDWGVSGNLESFNLGTSNSSTSDDVANKRQRLQSSFEQHVLQSSVLGASPNSCLERPVLQSNTLNEGVVDPVSPPLRDDVPLSEKGSTSAFTECHSGLPVPVQARVIGMVGHLGLPRGLAIGDEDGADAGVPSCLTRLYHPPER
jgi:hypothetical protein